MDEEGVADLHPAGGAAPTPRLRTRRTYAATPVADLVGGGFPVLATFGLPHVSIVLPQYNEAHVRALIEILGPEQPNPCYMRTPR